MTELYKWYRNYAPRNQDDEFHPLFVESLQKIDYIEYLKDILTRGSEEDKRDLYENGRAEIEKIREQLDGVTSELKRKKRAKAAEIREMQTQNESSKSDKLETSLAAIKNVEGSDE